MLGMAAYLYVYFVFLTWLPSYLILDRHMSILKTGVFSTFPFLIAVLIGVFSGWLSDRWIRSGASLSLVRKTFVGGGFALSTIFIIVGTRIQAQGPALFCIFMSMGVMGMVSPNINALPLDLAPRRVVASVVALQQVGGQIGGALAPIVTGVLFGRSGSFTLALVVTGGVALVFGTVVHVFLLGRIEPCIGVRKETAPIQAKGVGGGV
jgi:ACS family glucarate transporter-like MFS transporter